MAIRKNAGRAFRVRIRFLRRLLWIALALAVAWALYGLVGDYVLLPIAERQIHEMTGAQVTIGHLEFSGFSAVRMRNLHLRSPQVEHYEGEILKVQQLDGHFSLASIALLRPRLASVNLQGVEINAQYDASRRVWNLGALKIVPHPGRRLPVIQVEKGTLRLQCVDADRVTPLAVVNISGSLAQAGRQFGTYSFAIKAEPGAGFAGSELRGIWKAAPTGRLVVDGRLLMQDTPIYGNAWNLRNLHAAIAYDAEQVTLETIEFDVGANGHVRIDGRIEDLHGQGRYHLRVAVLNWELARGRGADRLVYNERVLTPFPRLAGLLERFKPQGRGDIDVTIDGTLDQPAAVQVDGTIFCRDVSASDARFPYRLEHLAGRLRVTQDSVVLEDLQGVHGDVHLTISGRSRGYAENTDCDIRLTSPDMRLDQDLYDALNERYRQLWETFSPQGTARIDYHLRRAPDIGRQVRVDVELIDAGALYAHFPYPLPNLTGRVILEPDRVTLENVTSTHDQRRIRLDGQVTDIASARPRFNIVIDANSIPIDDTLMAALPEQQRRFYESFELDAVTDVRVKVFPNEVGRRPVEYIAWATLRGASVAYERFPIPLMEVYAKATLTPDVIVLDEMRGRYGQGRVSVRGHIWPVTDRRSQLGYCLRLDAQRLELKPEWMAALPEAIRNAIGRLSPTGQVDVQADLNRDSTDPACPANRVVVDCLGNGVTFDLFPYPIQGLTGRLTITPDRVEVDHLHVPDIELGPELTKALRGKARQMFDALQPGGHIELTVDHAVFDPNAAAGALVEFVGAVHWQDGRLGPRGVINQIDIRSTGHGRYVLSHGLIAAAGRIEGRHLAIKGRSVENLRVDVVYDPNTGTFDAPELRADCYGGQILGRMQVGRPTTAGVPYSVDVLFDNVAFKGLASQEWVQRGQTSPERPGWASGAVQIRGRFGDAASHLGRISAGIAEVEVTRRSIIGKVLAALQLNKPTDYLFNQVDAEAYLRGDHLLLERVYMVGPSLVMEGRGRLDLQRMSVDLVFTIGRSVGPEPSFFRSLATAIGNAMVRVEVRGDIDDPQIATDALPLMTRPLYMLTPKGK